jgi:threonine aldolase
MHSVQPGWQFASDNTSGICPEAWTAMEEANEGFVPSYGDDVYTERASEMFRSLFETNCDVYFVFNGTAANSLALATLCQSYHSVVAHETSHVETDECGAPEFFSNGTKLLLCGGPAGKLDPAEIEKLVTKRNDIHFPKPKVVSFSSPTELGTVYTPSEARAVCEVARRHGLKVHMDGARFANGVASLGVAPSVVTWKAGVDVLSFGGTKLGMGIGEAVVFFDRALGEEFAYRCKQAGQLASKMRFLAAPWLALLKDGSWLKYASAANAHARRLSSELSELPGVKVIHPTQANAVFVQLPEEAHEALKAHGWRYYRFIGGGARFMCSWKTTNELVDALLADVRKAVG